MHPIRQNLIHIITPFSAHCRHSRLLIVIPAPAYARAGYGGNQLPQGGECCGGESRRELDGDFISPSFPRLPRESIGDNAKALSAALL